MVSWIPHVRRDLRIRNNGHAKEDQAAENPQLEQILSITDMLKKMSDRQALLTEDLSNKKIRSDLLRNIQKELIKDWKAQSRSSGAKSSEEEIINITLNTARKSVLPNTIIDEQDLQFMLIIGWKLAQYNIGLTHTLEADDQYTATKAELVKHMASIPNEKVNNALTAYLNFSFALNSGYLFSSYLSANLKMKKSLQPNLSPSRIKYARDTGLKSLLSYSQGLVEDISQGSTKLD